jgi:hypothetical protein
MTDETETTGMIAAMTTVAADGTGTETTVLASMIAGVMSVQRAETEDPAATDKSSFRTSDAASLAQHCDRAREIALFLAAKIQGTNVRRRGSRPQRALLTLAYLGEHRAGASVGQTKIDASPLWSVQR